MQLASAVSKLSSWQGCGSVIGALISAERLALSRLPRDETAAQRDALHLRLFLSHEWDGVSDLVSWLVAQYRPAVEEGCNISIEYIITNLLIPRFWDNDRGADPTQWKFPNDEEDQWGADESPGVTRALRAILVSAFPLTRSHSRLVPDELVPRYSCSLHNTEEHSLEFPDLSDNQFSNRLVSAIDGNVQYKYKRGRLVDMRDAAGGKEAPNIVVQGPSFMHGSFLQGHVMEDLLIPTWKQQNLPEIVAKYMQSGTLHYGVSGYPLMREFGRQIPAEKIEAFDVWARGARSTRNRHSHLHPHQCAGQP
ncbi:uncharacterized protein F4807DRAFT_462716 [Annulohypoxylon truncatum]|uniref:uncharacterized protein n=1 Tax=Annulohypoxylon truncatum TaxID=327061 RepID=UPI0020086B2E|nr:uncharacterized protein F4807DRAFT_462716 [Annulohypoxylon truncatum]KAI1207562.1 hypothetical protein F4807DRAFT_462716 [Annulohypoxylon truncatum]